MSRAIRTFFNQILFMGHLHSGIPYCSICGASTGMSETTSCRSCGAIYQGGNYCTSCGGRL
jgi:hypothetical protein